MKLPHPTPGPFNRVRFVNQPLRWLRHDGNQHACGHRVHERLQHPRRDGGSRVDDPDSVFNGMRQKNGWQISGLPWTYDLDRGKMALPEREETGKIHPGNAKD
jgi:hypothetical protein